MWLVNALLLFVLLNLESILAQIDYIRQLFRTFRKCTSALKSNSAPKPSLSEYGIHGKKKGNRRRQNIRENVNAQKLLWIDGGEK